MTLRAHEVPVLPHTGPVQLIGMRDALVRIEMKPALAAFGLRTAVPGGNQRLYSPTGKFDQVLLQRRDAKCVADLELGELAVGTVGADSELIIVLEEGAGN